MDGGAPSLANILQRTRDGRAQYEAHLALCRTPAHLVSRTGSVWKLAITRERALALCQAEGMTPADCPPT